MSNKKVELTLEPKVEVYKSKTLWMVAANWAVVKFFPGAQEWISRNPEAYAEALGLAFIVLRNFTTGQIKWKFWQKTQLEVESDERDKHGR